MLREMSGIQWLHWKTYMQLAPFEEDRMDIRFALIALSIWNVEIAKAQGSWDASKSKKGKRPEFRQLSDFLIRFGDAPDYAKPKPEPTGRGIFDMFKESLESQGLKPVKKLDAYGPETSSGVGKVTVEST